VAPMWFNYTMLHQPWNSDPLTTTCLGIWFPCLGAACRQYMDAQQACDSDVDAACVPEAQACSSDDLCAINCVIPQGDAAQQQCAWAPAAAPREVTPSPHTNFHIHSGEASKSLRLCNYMPFSRQLICHNPHPGAWCGCECILVCELQSLVACIVDRLAS